MPPCASLTTNSTPSSPRSFSERNTSPHACSPSLSPTRQSSTSRRPSAVNPTTTSTAWLITLPSTRTRSYRASIIRYGQLVWSSRRRRNSPSFSSSSAATRLTVIADTSPAPIASRTSRTLRVLTPWKYISPHATSNALSLRCHRANIDGWYGSHPRTCGTDSSSSPTRVFSRRGLLPLRWPLAIRRPLVRPRTPEVLAHLRIHRRLDHRLQHGSQTVGPPKCRLQR